MIIKCPECGHQVSDKAATCPNCGVKIAGNVVKCSKCGSVYLREDGFCPQCYQSADSALPPTAATSTVSFSVEQNDSQSTTSPAAPQSPTPSAAISDSESEQAPPPKKKGAKTAVAVAIVLALVIFGTSIYLYRQALQKRELEEWEIAMKSSDPLLLQQYLDTFKDADLAHRDSILAHLHLIQQRDDDWTQALSENTRDAFQHYLDNHPESQHKIEAKLKVDSIDWIAAQQANTTEAYEQYMRAHDDGEHYDEAEDAMKRMKAKELTAEERASAKAVVRSFFLAFNEHNDVALTDCLAEPLTLLDKPNASKNDAVDMMNRFYKEGVSGIVWALSDRYDVKKREVGDGQYEYAITINATETVHHDGAPDEKNSFRVNATINPDQKISLIRITKQVEDKSDSDKKEEKKSTATSDKPASPPSEKTE